MDVVICSNSPVIVEMVSRALQQDGNRSMTCECGLEVLGLIEVLHCDLLVLDLEMPGLGNHLLISAIREVAPTLPILAVSIGNGVDVRELSEKGVPYVRLDAEATTSSTALLADMMRSGLSAPGYARQTG